MKRFDHHLLGYLTREEIDAIITAPGDSTRAGRRDQTMFSMFYNTGARTSEIIGLRVADISLERAIVTIHGKGRKQRTVPLWKNTVARLREWLRQIGEDPMSPVFPNSRGQSLSRSGVESRLRRAVHVASQQCPSLHQRAISPHTLRHTTAMHLLQAGVDVTVIAIWLGHESTATTHRYIEADLAMKQRALEKLDEPDGQPRRYEVPDKLLQFLESL
jgi:integrase/recombinase XerD